MWYIKYTTHDGRLVEVISGAVTRDEAIALLKTTDSHFRRIEKVTNIVGEVWQLSAKHIK